MNRRTFIQRASGLGAAVGAGLCSLSFVGDNSPDRKTVRDVGLTPQLFLDDYVVESAQGLKRQLHRPPTHLNAAALQGSIRVEVQDSAGTPVSGLALRDHSAITGAGISQPVRWGEKIVPPPDLIGKPVRLRFEVRGGDLFGFQWQA